MGPISSHLWQNAANSYHCFGGRGIPTDVANYPSEGQRLAVYIQAWVTILMTTINNVDNIAVLLLQFAFSDAAIITAADVAAAAAVVCCC